MIHLPPTKALVVIPQSMPPRLDRTPKGLSDLVNVCLHDDPLQRPTANQLLKLKMLRGIDQKTMVRVMNELWREYQGRRMRIEPDRQSLLSKNSVGSCEGEEEYWSFDGEYNIGAFSEPLLSSPEDEDVVAEDATELERSQSVPVEEEARQQEEPRRLSQSQMSISTVSSSMTTTTARNRRSTQHRRTPSLLSLQLSDYKGVDEINRLPGIYYDLIGSCEEDKKERRELAVLLKTDRHRVELKSAVTSKVVESQLEYISERLDRIKRALHLTSLYISHH